MDNLTAFFGYVVTEQNTFTHSLTSFTWTKQSNALPFRTSFVNYGNRGYVSVLVNQLTNGRFRPNLSKIYEQKACPFTAVQSIFSFLVPLAQHGTKVHVLHVLYSISSWFSMLGRKCGCNVFVCWFVGTVVDHHGRWILCCDRFYAQGLSYEDDLFHRRLTHLIALVSVF